MPLVYKIISEQEWKTAGDAGEFLGAEIDLQDGYIHLSTAAQVRETVARHFAGRSELLLLTISAEDFGDDMKWEPSRGGDLFPHLYCSLPVNKVLAVDALPMGTDGLHIFPEGFPSVQD